MKHVVEQRKVTHEDSLRLFKCKFAPTPNLCAVEHEYNWAWDEDDTGESQHAGSPVNTKVSVHVCRKHWTKIQSAELGGPSHIMELTNRRHQGHEQRYLLRLRYSRLRGTHR